MSIPSVPSHWTTRKDLLERAIVRRHEKEARYRQSWDSASRYFDHLQLKAVKHDSWTSEGLYKVCNEAFNARKAKEEKQEKLAARRAKLLQLLQQEEKLYEAELEVMRECKRTPSISNTRQCLEELWIRKEADRKSVDERRLSHHSNASDLSNREIETHRLKQEAIKSLSQQLRMQEERKKSEERTKVEEKKRVEGEYKRLEEERKLQESERLAESSRLHEILKNQVEVLKLREAEATRLKKEQELLLQRQWFLDQEEESRRQRYVQANRKEYGRQLMHQSKVQLQKRAREICDELDKDQEMLEHFAKEQRVWTQETNARREKVIADAAAAQKMIAEHMNREKARKTEVELLFNEEAARVWRKREAEWERERQMREKLLREVMEGLRLQIQDRIAENLKLQEVSIREREDLLRNMEAIKAEGREKLAVKQQQKEAWGEELKEQMAESEERTKAQMSYQVQERNEMEARRANEGRVPPLDIGEDAEDVRRPSSSRLSFRSAGTDEAPASCQRSGSGRRYAWT